MIYLPLLLLGVQRVIDGKSPCLFILAVFVSAVSNFYFFYMLAIAIAVYCLFRLAFIYKKRFSRIILKLAHIGAYAFIGVMLSAFILLPVAAAFISDGRNESASVLSLFYSVKYYLNFPAAFTVSTVTAGEAQTLLGFSSLSLFGIISLFLSKKEHIESKTLFIFVTVLLMLPVTALAANGFAYPANRWIWAYALLVSYIFSVQLDRLDGFDKKRSTVFLFVALAYLIICLLTQKTGEFIMFSCLSLCVFALILLFGKRLSYRFKALTALVLVVATVGVNGSAYYFENPSFTDKFHTAESISADFNKTLGRAVRSKTKDDSFWRYSADSDTYDYNRDVLSDTCSTSFYWSLQNTDIAEFMKELELPYSYLYMYQNLDRRASLNTLAGVKYYCSKYDGRVPYGYEYIKNSGVNGNRIYLSESAMPLCFTYDSYITKSVYEKYNAVDRQYLMMNAAVLEEAPEGFSQSSVVTDSVSLPYTVTGEKVNIDGDRITAECNGAVLCFNFEGLPDCETYFRFSYDNFESDNSISKLELKFTPYVNDAPKNKASVTLLSFDNERKDNRRYYTVNLGYGEEGKTCADVVLPYKGVYTFSDIEIICQPMENFDKQVSALKEQSTESFNTENGVVTGTVNLSRDSILCFTVPYSSGWSATVDGKEAKLLKCNTMMTALPLDAGEHEVTLTYKTPFFAQGAAVTLLGAAAFSAVLVYRKRRSDTKAAVEGFETLRDGAAV